jgi:hypothetical protein
MRRFTALLPILSLLLATTAPSGAMAQAAAPSGVSGQAAAPSGVSGQAAAGDADAVGAEPPAARELAGKARVRKESIRDEEFIVLDPRDPRLAPSPALPPRTGFVAAGMGFAIVPTPPVAVETRPSRLDRGFRVER